MNTVSNLYKKMNENRSTSVSKKLISNWIIAWSICVTLLFSISVMNYTHIRKTDQRLNTIHTQMDSLYRVVNNYQQHLPK